VRTKFSEGIKAKTAKGFFSWGKKKGLKIFNPNITNHFTTILIDGCFFLDKVKHNKALRKIPKRGVALPSS
jgi:hypothetical protein